MADPGFPGQHTTTTTVTTSNTNVQTNIRYDPSYIKTIPGMLKCAQIFFGYINTVIYGYDCYLKYKSIQNGEIAQGERFRLEDPKKIVEKTVYVIVRNFVKNGWFLQVELQRAGGTNLFWLRNRIPNTVSYLRNYGDRT
uniref:Uncharacterized protein n=1 Tax=Rhodnius prolixus TaxID=13249 RepID=T1HAD9_RHOPR